MHTLCPEYHTQRARLHPGSVTENRSEARMPGIETAQLEDCARIGTPQNGENSFKNLTARTQSTYFPPVTYENATKSVICAHIACAQSSATSNKHMNHSAIRRYVAEFIGTAFLLATVVGSGIMAEQLANGNNAIALLGNTIATGAILYVLITAFGPVSGAHFNPAVSLVFALRRELTPADCAIYVLVQIAGALVGVVLAHVMFELQVVQFSLKVRDGGAQWLSEGIATFGLLMTILITLKTRADAVATSVGLYITAAYWFTASTSFANPAVTIARSFTDTFSGIQPAHATAFIVAQIFGALIAWVVCRWIVDQTGEP